MAEPPVIVEGLDHLLHDLRRMDLTIDHAVTTALAEAKERWKEDIRGTGQAPGGDKTWPIGTTRKSKRTGKKYYVEPGKGARSGRSLDSWELQQSKGRLLAYNDATDPNTGDLYAAYVHLRGDSTGQAARDAWVFWAQEMDQAAREIEEIIAKELEG
tara:strand:+ start:209 stop:679 length:471 start_codon:yes stop_codon:yes gene_type:complete